MNNSTLIYLPNGTNASNPITNEDNDDDDIFAFITRMPGPPQVIGLCIGIPSAVLCIFELALLATYWTTYFRTSFFALFGLRTILSLFSFCCQLFSQRFGRLGLFLGLYSGMPQFLLNFLYFSIYYSFHSESLATVFLLLNRFSAIIMPFKYEKLWRLATPLAILLTLIIPLIPTGHILYYNVFIQWQQGTNNGTFLLAYLAKTTSKSSPFGIYLGNLGNNFLVATSALIFMAICALLNILTLFCYRRMRRRASNWNGANLGGIASENKNSTGQINSSQQRAERKMMLYAMFVFVAQLLQAIYMILWYYVSNLVKFPTEDRRQLVNAALINQYAWVHDLSTLCIPAWLMLWASDRMRRALWRAMPRPFQTKFASSIVAVGAAAQRQNVLPAQIQRGIGGNGAIFPGATNSLLTTEKSLNGMQENGQRKASKPLRIVAERRERIIKRRATVQAWR